MPKKTKFDDLPGYKMRRVSLLSMAALSKALADIELRVTEAIVLLQIQDEPGLTLSEIGRRLDIKRANVTPLVGGLVERNLVRSEVKDGRSQALFLSEVGEDVASRAYSTILHHEETFFQALSGDKLTELTESLGVLWTEHSKTRDTNN